MRSCTLPSLDDFEAVVCVPHTPPGVDPRVCANERRATCDGAALGVGAGQRDVLYHGELAFAYVAVRPKRARRAAAAGRWCPEERSARGGGGGGERDEAPSQPYSPSSRPLASNASSSPTCTSARNGIAGRDGDEVVSGDATEKKREERERDGDWTAVAQRDAAASSSSSPPSSSPSSSWSSYDSPYPPDIVESFLKCVEVRTYLEFAPRSTSSRLNGGGSADGDKLLDQMVPVGPVHSGSFAVHPSMDTYYRLLEHDAAPWVPLDADEADGVFERAVAPRIGPRGAAGDGRARSATPPAAFARRCLVDSNVPLTVALNNDAPLTLVAMLRHRGALDPPSYYMRGGGSGASEEATEGTTTAEEGDELAAAYARPDRLASIAASLPVSFPLHAVLRARTAVDVVPPLRIVRERVVRSGTHGRSSVLVSVPVENCSDRRLCVWPPALHFYASREAPEETMMMNAGGMVEEDVAAAIEERSANGGGGGGDGRAWRRRSERGVAAPQPQPVQNFAPPSTSFCQTAAGVLLERAFEVVNARGMQRDAEAGDARHHDDDDDDAKALRAHGANGGGSAAMMTATATAVTAAVSDAPVVLASGETHAFVLCIRVKTHANALASLHSAFSSSSSSASSAMSSVADESKLYETLATVAWTGACQHAMRRNTPAARMVHTIRWRPGAALATLPTSITMATKRGRSGVALGSVDAAAPLPPSSFFGDVSLSIRGPRSVTLGVAFCVHVRVHNRGSAPVEHARLELPAWGDEFEAGAALHRVGARGTGNSLAEGAAAADPAEEEGEEGASRALYRHASVETARAGRRIAALLSQPQPQPQPPHCRHEQQQLLLFDGRAPACTVDSILALRARMPVGTLAPGASVEVRVPCAASRAGVACLRDARVIDAHGTTAWCADKPWEVYVVAGDGDGGGGVARDGVHGRASDAARCVSE